MMASWAAWLVYTRSLLLRALFFFFLALFVAAVHDESERLVAVVSPLLYVVFCVVS